MSTALKRWVIPSVLLIAIFAVYRQVIEHDFTFFDDHAYITRNPMVLVGLTWHSVELAFLTGCCCNYHPLTWISHMLDMDMFGLWAGGHAFTNLLWHCANVLLVWRLARLLSGRDAVGFFVAILFAIHPLNVEAVASISQRKTVLSACFGLLSLLAYLRYAERGGAWRYLLSFVWAAMSLLAKPLFVTLPALLLLLDFWPLARFPRRQDYPPMTQPGTTPVRGRPANWRTLLSEKIPFAVLAGACGLATFHFQQVMGAMSTAKVDAFTSLAAAVSSYIFYLQKLFWPVGLAAFYSLPKSYAVLHLVTSAGILLAISTAFWGLRRRRPYLIFGWMWFLGTLIPMAGFIRVGAMGMADRYAYVPLLGVYFLITLLVTEWGDSLTSRRPFIRLLLPGCGVISIVGLALVTHRQVSYWRTTYHLYERIIATQGENEKLYNLMGYEAFDQREFDRAIPYFQKTLTVAPNDPDATANLGISLFAVGRFVEADTWLERSAKQHQTPSAGVLNARGKIAEQQGRINDACNFWRAAIIAAPSFGEARHNLAHALLQNGTADEALVIIDVGIHETPWDDQLHDDRAKILETLGRTDDARSARDTAAKERRGNSIEPALQNSSRAGTR